MTTVEQLRFSPDASNAPLFMQLYAQLRESIYMGAIKPGTKMPSTRALAQQLNLSRNTIVGAYDQLQVEGWIESTAASGTYVALRLPAKAPATKNTISSLSPTSISKSTQTLSVITKTGSPRISVDAPKAFRVGLPALDAFPIKQWARLLRQRSMRLGDALNDANEGGYRPLRHAIAEHVAIARQIACDPAQVVIVPGAQGGFDLSCRVLLDPGDPVWVEDPGYRGARLSLVAAGARLVPVPVDAEGIDVAAGRKLGIAARAAFVTPSHQYPLGVMMSLSRRLALLDWAAQHDAYVVEDDYDSDFQYKGRPLAALYALDRHQRVLYCGTFSKNMFPALRIGYLIVPPQLVDACLSQQRAICQQHPSLEQMVLADFIADGHFNRHLKAMRTLYLERRNTLVEALADGPLVIQPTHTGIHVVAWPNEPIDIPASVASARKAGVIVETLSDSAILPPERNAFVLGYAASTPREIVQAAKILTDSLVKTGTSNRP